MSILYLPHDMLSNIISFLDARSFYKFSQSCTSARMEYNTEVEAARRNNNIYIYLQVETRNLFYKKYKFIISRHEGELYYFIHDLKYRIGETIDSHNHATQYSFTKLSLDNNIRNIRFYGNSIRFTRVIDKKYIKFKSDALLCTTVRPILDKLDKHDTIKTPFLKDRYYILYNSSVSTQGKLSASGRIIYNYVYNEWDFNGIYLCNNTTDILETIVILLKRGLVNGFKRLEINTYGNVVDYVNELLKHTSLKTIKFIKNLRYASVSCNNLYSIHLINRWKPVYEYGNNILNIDEGGCRIIETDYKGDERYVESYDIYNIDGIKHNKPKIINRITEYFS